MYYCVIPKNTSRCILKNVLLLCFTWFVFIHQFVIEGTVGAGSKGDIALDDLTILDGTCEMITRQGRSFE